MRIGRGLAAVAVLAASMLLTACNDQTQPARTSAAPPCPTDPVQVVVSIDQWGDVVSQLGGNCATVTTVLAGSSVDPHDYEPGPADAVHFDGAQLVVINGGHYDEWAAKLAASTAPDAARIDAVELAGHPGPDQDGHDHTVSNPHVWYQPSTVFAVADAVTTHLSELAPDAADYFAERRAEFDTAMQPYGHALATIKEQATGRAYAATESLYDDTAAALGLVNATPSDYRTAANNHTEPTPGALDAFLTLLADRGVDVLIYGTQTQGSIPEQIRSAAEAAGIPVVEVTETVAPGAESFQAWQVDQLTALAEALGVEL